MPDTELETLKKECNQHTEELLNTASVQCYDHEAEELTHPWETKIQKFIAHGCIKLVHRDLYVCLPLLGYNTRTYNLTRRPNGFFKCNCQGYNKRGDCSHVQALYRIIKNDNRQGTLF